MSYRSVMCERVRYLFARARDAGCSTDHWMTHGPDEVDQICGDLWMGDFAGALARMDGASDPRWDELRWYLQGLSDGTGDPNE